ncbi:hypothetical protein AOLI_G00199460 [Acnodon oligacanthus]
MHGNEWNVFTSSLPLSQQITVTDHGVPARSTTVRVIVKVLDENDNRPVFMEKVYKIKLPERDKAEKAEKSFRRNPVYRVIASDRDDGPNAEISYSIEEGDELGKFFIEPKTGLVSSKNVSSAGEYDILTIKAVDNGRPQKSSTCRLHIEWIPKPEPSSSLLAFDESVFSFTVMESDPVAHMVGVITMETVDTPVWFEITGGNSDHRFDVDKASGTLVVARPLNTEQKSNYNLTLEATDGTRTTSTQVLIKVIDTNNHRPQFSEPRYEVTVREDAPPETEALRLRRIVNGRLQYKFDCGSGPGVVSVHSPLVSDGEWHSVSLEVDGNYARLVLDGVHAASGKAPGNLRTLNLDTSVFFGGRGGRSVGGSGGRLGRSLPVTGGLRGCLEAIVLNGRDLPLRQQPRGAHGVLEELVEAAPGCSLPPPAPACTSNPCSNGGTCTELPNGGYFCKCSALFMGTHCEVSISPCSSNPCLYGGTCVPRGDDFYCQCRGQYSGQRCQLGPYCTENPCKNSGRCIDSLDGPVCECEPGFQGDRCLSDVDECMKNPCANGGQCHNTYGSFSCNCSLGFGGRQCELRAEVRNDFISTSWNIGLEEVIGIAVFVASIFLIVLLFVLIRKRACRRSKSDMSPDDSTKRLGGSGPHSFLQRPYFDSKPSKNIYSDVPPQVPVRPISYTPSIPSDSRNNLDRNSFEGSTIPEHPEFSTFNPDSIHGHRKTVAVCSVAPNLPPPPPSNSVSDSDSIQKPSWDYDYDAKVVDLDPCLSKKAVEDSACHPYNTRGSMSEVQSLSSFQSESCDDNAPIWIKPHQRHRARF